jgi:hypothetical protein
MKELVHTGNDRQDDKTNVEHEKPLAGRLGHPD